MKLKKGVTPKFNEFLYQWFSRRMLWTQRNGKKIRVKDMDDKHLCNTIRMLERKHQQRISEHEALWFGPEPQGEYAMMALDEARDAAGIFDGVDLAVRSPMYCALAEEAERRELIW